MIISTDVEKALDKIQHPNMMNILKKLEMEGNYLNIIKAIHQDPTDNIILNDEKLKVFLLRLRERQGCPPFLLLFNIVLEGLTRAITQKKIKDK